MLQRNSYDARPSSDKCDVADPSCAELWRASPGAGPTRFRALTRWLRQRLRIGFHLTAGSASRVEARLESSRAKRQHGDLAAGQHPGRVFRGWAEASERIACKSRTRR